MEIFGCKNIHAADFFRTLCWWSFQQILKITLIMDHLFVSMDSRFNLFFNVDWSMTHCWSPVHLSLFIDLIFVDLIFSVFSIQGNLKKHCQFIDPDSWVVQFVISHKATLSNIKMERKLEIKSSYYRRKKGMQPHCTLLEVSQIWHLFLLTIR